MANFEENESSKITGSRKVERQEQSREGGEQEKLQSQSRPQSHNKRGSQRRPLRARWNQQSAQERKLSAPAVGEVKDLQEVQEKLSVVADEKPEWKGQDTNKNINANKAVEEEEKENTDKFMNNPKGHMNERRERDDRAGGDRGYYSRHNRGSTNTEERREASEHSKPSQGCFCKIIGFFKKLFGLEDKKGVHGGHGARGHRDGNQHWRRDGGSHYRGRSRYSKPRSGYAPREKREGGDSRPFRGSNRPRPQGYNKDNNPSSPKSDS
jgi:hypothetical protein